MKSADLKGRFLFKSFPSFRSSWMKGKAADCHLLLRTTAEIKASGDSVGFFFAISPKSHEYTASIISSMQMHSNLEFPSFFVQNIKKVFYFLYFYKSILLWIVHIQHR